jgi:polyhydroxyalkanoate synthesis regulator phasin
MTPFAIGKERFMDRRKLVLTGVVAGSVGVGSLIGAIAFAPGIGLAASGIGTGDRALAICAGAAGSLDAAAGAIGIGTSDLLSALRNGRTIAEAAQAHDVPVTEVVDAIVTSEQDRLDELVEDGRLTQEQAEELSADLAERVTDLVNGDLAPFPLVGRPGSVGVPGLIGGHGPWGFAGPIAVAAEAIGVDASALLAQLADGSTIAEVAQANDVPVSEVVDALVSSMQERLDAAVENGWITQDQADAISEDLRERAAELVNGEAIPFPHPMWRFAPDPGASASELSLF